MPENGNSCANVMPNAAVIASLRKQEGLTQQQLADEADISLRTYQRIETGNSRARFEHLLRIAERLDCKVEQLIHPSELAALEQLVVREWDFEKGAKAISDWQILPNGLRVEFYELTSTTVPGRKARGKRYNLRFLNKDQRNAITHWLVRHTETCERVDCWPHIVRPIISEPSPDRHYWWVVDEWVDGNSLRTVLESRDSRIDVPRIAHEILRGLQALHQVGIIRRGLCPESVILRRSDGGAVLTDFEISKFLDPGPTITPSGGFRQNPYFAPEVQNGGREIGPQADLFSWACIVLEMITGRAARSLGTDPSLNGVRMPAALVRLLRHCLAVRWTERPDSVAQALRIVSSWTTAH